MTNQKLFETILHEQTAVDLGKTFLEQNEDLLKSVVSFVEENGKFRALNALKYAFDEIVAKVKYS